MITKPCQPDHDQPTRHTSLTYLTYLPTNLTYLPTHLTFPPT